MAQSKDSPEVFTQFTPEAPLDPTRPGVVSEGKIMDAIVQAGATEVSISAKVLAHPGIFPRKTLYVESSLVGAFVIEVVLDESERVGSNMVWHAYTDPASPIATVAGVLTKINIDELFRQVRIKFTAGVGPVTVKAWIFSIG